MTQKIAIDDIVVGVRHRKDMGDLTSLAKSMEASGQLQNIVVDSDGNLICGERRVEAAKILSWTELDCRVVDDFDEQMKLIAERDENACRLDFTPSEAVALGRALEPKVQAEAKARQRARKGNQRSSHNSGNFPELSGKAEARDVIGKAVGMSGPTYNRAKAVVKAAEDEPGVFGDIAEEMDRTGKVSPAYEKVKAIKSGAPKAQAELPVDWKTKSFSRTAINKLNTSAEKLVAILEKPSMEVSIHDAHKEAQRLLEMVSSMLK